MQGVGSGAGTHAGGALLQAGAEGSSRHRSIPPVYLFKVFGGELIWRAIFADGLSASAVLRIYGKLR